MPRKIGAAIREHWESLVLPLPSARLKADPAADYAPLLDAVMAEAGVPLDRMRVPGLHKPFFSKGDRPARIAPAGLTASAAADEVHPGRTKLALAFELPRGAYATMVVKRLTAADS